MKKRRQTIKLESQAKVASAQVLQKTWRMVADRRLAKAAMLNRIHSASVAATDKAIRRGLANAHHRLCHRLKKNEQTEVQRQRSATVIQQLWSSAKKHYLKRGRWSELYKARRLVNDQKIEKRKEEWSQRMIKRAESENLGLREQGRGSDPLQHAWDLELDDIEGVELKLLVESEARSRQAAELRMLAIQQALDNKMMSQVSIDSMTPTTTTGLERLMVIAGDDREASARAQEAARVVERVRRGEDGGRKPPRVRKAGRTRK
jgi:hypothetical protein